jgi:hypothetical protein
MERSNGSSPRGKAKKENQSYHPTIAKKIGCSLLRPK